MGLVPRLEGYEPSIPLQNRSDDELTPGQIQKLEEPFEDEDEVEVSQLRDILYRNSTKRQKLFESDVFVDKLTEDMDEGERIKTIILILGEYPEQEKLFLIEVLSSGMDPEIKFRFLEEIIFSKSEEFLDTFRRGSSSDDLVKELEDNPIYGNENITNSVKTVLNGETDPLKIFEMDEEMYEMGDGGRSLKTTYMLCRESRPLRLAYLKSLLLEADRNGDLVMVLKIVLSHCDVDLKSMLQNVSLSPEDVAKAEQLKFAGCSTTDMGDEITELETVNNIQNVNLKKFVQFAAFART